MHRVRRNTSRARQKAASQDKQFGNPQKIIDIPTEQLINWQLVIKLGQFTEKELHILRAKKNK